MKVVIDIEKEHYKYICNHYTGKETAYLAIKDGLVLSDNILTVEEKPQGEWVVVNQDNEGIHEIECPFCHYSKGSDFSSLLTVTFERFPPFCEKCGAELRGVEDDTARA